MASNIQTNDTIEFENNLENLMKEYDERYESNLEEENTSESIDFSVPEFDLEDKESDTIYDDLLKMFDAVPTEEEKELKVESEEPIQFDDLEKQFKDEDIKKNNIEDEDLSRKFQNDEFQNFIKELDVKYGQYYITKMDSREREKYILLNSNAYNIPIKKSESSLNNMIKYTNKKIEQEKEVIDKLKEQIELKNEYIYNKLNSSGVSSEDLQNDMIVITQDLDIINNMEDDTVEKVNEKNTKVDEIVARVNQFLTKVEEYKIREEKNLKEQKKLINEFRKYHISLATEKGKNFYVNMTDEEIENYITLYSNAYKVSREESVNTFEHLTLQAYTNIKKEEEELLYNDTLDSLNKYFNYYNEVKDNDNFDAMKMCYSFINDIVKKYNKATKKELPEGFKEKIDNITNEVKERIKLIKRKYDSISISINEKLLDTRSVLSDEEFINIKSSLNKVEISQDDITRLEKINNYLEEIKNKTLEQVIVKPKIIKEEKVTKPNNKIDALNKEVTSKIELLKPYCAKSSKLDEEISKVIIENNKIDLRTVNNENDYIKLSKDKLRLINYLDKVIDLVNKSNVFVNEEKSLDEYKRIINKGGRECTELLKDIYFHFNELDLNGKAKFKYVHQALNNISKNKVRNIKEAKQQLVDLENVTNDINELKDVCINKIKK